MSYNNEPELDEENNNEEYGEYDSLPEGIEYVSITVLHRQTNGPHPDCDLEIDAVVTPTQEEEEDPDQEDLPPPHPLDLGFFNFVDNNPYSIFYNRMYNIIDPRTIRYDETDEADEHDEDEEDKIREIYMENLDMPTPCLSCSSFECNC